ncbi:cardiolipin synthase [Pusillimonas harenae]|uniref:Cardiolipin synthase n=2 Tax=Pollutimonas harenae TaxID=657015 RepID=A0A853H5G3_9BURK|nr:phospholipase D-like domain-containing protein [Pollutimonas harenae]NYT86415.1 cardiolipin synthase [Pollutimonas harenae]
MAYLEYLASEYWPHLALLLSIAVGGTAAVHAAMTKNDVRAAIGWVGIIMMSPLLGPFIYLIAGINRIRHDHISEQRNKSLKHGMANPAIPLADISNIAAAQFESLRVLGDRISHFPLCDGNHIQLLLGGDQAYPSMIEAIDQASKSIALQTYIFDNDSEGRKFVDALTRAVARGVQVRVLIDAVGSKYSRPPIIRLLRKKKITAALFMTNPLGFMRMPYANLRSHRKILVIDGSIAFTGGMNIREEFVSAVAGANTCSDTHFKVEGPVVLQLLSVFVHDWEFTTKENLPFKTWCGSTRGASMPQVPARAIRSGPDRYIVGTHNMLLGAFAVAQKHIRIQSPYFLPDQVLLGAINTAARRGIVVDIVIPGRNNLRLVNYAMTAQLDQVIHNNCRVWRASGNFNHSKLITIDGTWSYVGSSNMDPRSLRLNFELDMEVYGHELAAKIENLIDSEIENSDMVTLEDLAAIPFRKRLRNRIIWLASPYL